MVAEKPIFYIQETFEPEMVSLYCGACGHNTRTEIEWLRARQGDTMGCFGCGRLATVPFIHEIGV